MRPFRVFVTATDTGVGKTQTTCALLSLLADGGLRPAAMKPYESGCADLAHPADAQAMRAAARCEDALDDLCPHRFGAPLAPGAAAAREGRAPSWRRTLAAFHRFDGRPLVVEGAGGLLVPVDSKRDIIDVIVAFELPVILVARAGLGTLNHTGLSLELLKRRRVPVWAVLLSRSAPGRADPSERDNAEWIRRRHRVPVFGPVPYLRDPRRRARAFRDALSPLVERRA